MYEFLTGRVQISSSFMIKQKIFKPDTKMQVFYEYIVSVQFKQRTLICPDVSQFWHQIIVG